MRREDLAPVNADAVVCATGPEGVADLERAVVGACPRIDHDPLTVVLDGDVAEVGVLVRMLQVRP